VPLTRLRRSRRQSPTQCPTLATTQQTAARRHRALLLRRRHPPRRRRRRHAQRMRLARLSVPTEKTAQKIQRRVPLLSSRQLQGAYCESLASSRQLHGAHCERLVSCDPLQGEHCERRQPIGYWRLHSSQSPSALHRLTLSASRQSLRCSTIAAGEHCYEEYAPPPPCSASRRWCCRLAPLLLNAMPATRATRRHRVAAAAAGLQCELPWPGSEAQGVRGQRGAAHDQDSATELGAQSCAC
jgi:hypothetical protein